MISNEILHYKIFGAMLLVGFGVGLLTSVILGITQKSNNNIVLKNITHFFCVIVLGAAFFVSINFLNFGQFRAFLLVSFLLGFLIEYKLLNKLIAKTIQLGYNLTIKAAKSLEKSKLGKKLFR